MSRANRRVNFGVNRYSPARAIADARGNSRYICAKPRADQKAPSPDLHFPRVYSNSRGICILAVFIAQYPRTKIERLEAVKVPRAGDAKKWNPI